MTEMCLEQLRSTGRQESSSVGDMSSFIENRMSADRRLWRPLLDTFVFKEILFAKGGFLFSRFPNVLLTIIKVLAQAHVGRTSPIGLDPHEDERRLQDFIGHGLVVRPHVLPQVIHHRLHGDRSIGENIAPHDWHQSLVVCLAIIERHVVKRVYADQIYALPAETHGLTVNEEENREQRACKRDPIVQSHGEVEACYSGKAGSHKSPSGPLILKLPVFQEPLVDLLGDLIHEAMAFVPEQRWRC